MSNDEGMTRLHAATARQSKSNDETNTDVMHPSLILRHFSWPVCSQNFCIDSRTRFCDEDRRPARIQSTPHRKHLMNWKKFFFAFIAAFGFMFLFGFLWYGKLMHGAHQEVPILWRTESDFGNHFSSLVFGHVVMAFFLTLLYARFVPAGRRRLRDAGNPGSAGICRR